MLGAILLTIFIVIPFGYFAWRYYVRVKAGVEASRHPVAAQDEERRR